jgi:hypothetical protein
MASEQYRLLRHSVDHCPHCGHQHDYAVELKSAPLVFGGGSDEVRIAVSCPATGKPFQTVIGVPANEEFVRVITGSAADQVPEQPGPVISDSHDEYSEWVKSSRDTGVDFGKTMLTASSGAIAVYFAVLQYLGISKVSRSTAGVLAVLPPILFLAATTVFALALRPRLAPVTLGSFPSFRDERLRQLNRLLLFGTALFVFALAVALGVYIDIMRLL